MKCEIRKSAFRVKRSPYIQLLVGTAASEISIYVSIMQAAERSSGEGDGNEENLVEKVDRGGQHHRR
jgi:hypothetical protein